MYMDMARVASQRSTCSRLNVGAIITFHDSPVSIGWGGMKPGDPHCPGNTCPGMVPGNCPTIHAENNAMKKAVELLPRGSKVDMYSTHSPCKKCIYQLMRCEVVIKRLFFEIPYRETSPLDLIGSEYWGMLEEKERRKTEVYEVTTAGYIVNYFTRKIVELP